MFFPHAWLYTYPHLLSLKWLLMAVKRMQNLLCVTSAAFVALHVSQVWAKDPGPQYCFWVFTTLFWGWYVCQLAHLFGCPMRCLCWPKAPQNQTTEWKTAICNQGLWLLDSFTLCRIPWPRGLLWEAPWTLQIGDSPSFFSHMEIHVGPFNGTEDCPTWQLCRSLQDRRPWFGNLAKC